MSRILRWDLPQRLTRLDLPVGTKLLAVGSTITPYVKQPKHYVWVEQPVDARAETQPWVIHTLMSGEHVPPGLEHLGTHIGFGAAAEPYVTHFYREELR